ncbi:MAG TPA: EcsC family protein [Thermoanaerobaculia bacterium]|nr:EcsC family protein [Thermoanaerobaculia bacterium]
MPTRKKSDDHRFYDLIEKLFKEIDQDAIRAEVIALQRAKPNLTRAQIADQMTKKAAVRVASVGAAAGVPGGPLGVLAMAPDIFNLVLQQSRLILSIAFLYGQRPHLRDRFREVLATLAVATGSSAGRQGARLLIAKGLERAAAAKVAKKIFGRFFVRRLPAVAPLLGTVAGGTINYLSMRAVGRTAKAFYAGKETTEKKAKARKRATKKVASSGKKRAAKKTTKRARRGGLRPPGPSRLQD